MTVITRSRVPMWVLAAVLLVVALLAWWRQAMVGKTVFIRSGSIHVHTGDVCRTQSIPGFCWHNIPEFLCSRTHCGGQLTACKSNLKNIGTALEMYSTDHQGRFPDHLQDLVPSVLFRIPTCPSCGTDTYTGGYARSASPEAYTVVCSGWRHDGVGQSRNYPQYTSTHGIVSK